MQSLAQEFPLGLIKLYVVSYYAHHFLKVQCVTCDRCKNYSCATVQLSVMMRNDDDVFKVGVTTVGTIDCVLKG